MRGIVCFVNQPSVGYVIPPQPDTGAWRFAVALVSVLLVASALVTLVVAPANAASCSTHNIAWYQSDSVHRGVKAVSVSVYTHNYPDYSPNGSLNVTCDRVASLLMLKSDGSRQLEIGWQIVPGNDQICPVDTSHPQWPVFVIIWTNTTTARPAFTTEEF